MAARSDKQHLLTWSSEEMRREGEQSIVEEQVLGSTNDWGALEAGRSLEYGWEEDVFNA
jgi:hypothetical protein